VIIHRMVKQNTDRPYFSKIIVIKRSKQP